MAEVRDQISEVLYKAVSAAMNRPVEELTDAPDLVADLGAKSANSGTHHLRARGRTRPRLSFQEIRRRKTIGEIIDYLVELHES